MHDVFVFSIYKRRNNKARYKIARINITLLRFSLGPVELQVNLQQHDHSQTVVSVDLGSVHRTDDGNAVYRLEKADVLERNKWELIIVMGFHAGVVTTVKSKPFRITTRASHKTKSPELPQEKSSK